MIIDIASHFDSSARNKHRYRYRNIFGHISKLSTFTSQVDNPFTSTGYRSIFCVINNCSIIIKVKRFIHVALECRSFLEIRFRLRECYD